MAEQWKAYTMICEKYSNFLSDGDIYTKSTKVLVDIVRNNIKTAVEANEDKVVIRSLKVASFSLKILLRICKIFKGTSRNNYEDIVDVLQEILLSGSGQLQINTLLGLIQLYHKLQGNTVFSFSPQSTNLACTIENLFKILHYNEKLQLYKRYSIYDEKSYDLWAVLKIRNLPENLQMSARKVVIQKIVNMTEIHSEHLQTEQINDMIKIMKLASTCEYLECDSRVENVLVVSWRKVCPKTNNIKLEKYLDVGSLLYFRFLTALVSLTESYHERFSDKSHILKIVRVITDLLMLGNIETITALCRLFCKLVARQGRSQYDIILHTFKYLFESDVKQYVYSVITSNGDFDNFFTQMFHKEKALQEACSDIKKIKSIHRNNYDWQQKLRSVSEYRYTHKCIQSTDVAKFTTKSSECDFGSEDFEISSDNENDHRVNKKAKMDPSIGNILDRLESDVSQLCQVKENILNEQHKTRIRSVWEKLGNLT
ncbi:hypothetical protein KGM_211777 [Danaus plexippus plexippus]|uniref:Uncharacterized protein n=1 Tax=Danaus plexippus plexippus TaxID=278856 RepID=A0A212EX44_DANPL|nr:hypothetical protein KGM_211777 [Danaus plexippus plexippus]